MSRKYAGLIAAAVSLIWPGSLFAQVNLEDIRVRAATKRPGCDLPEGFIEAYNCGNTCYRLRVQRTYADAVGKVYCPGCSPADKCGVTQFDADGTPECMEKNDTSAPTYLSVDIGPRTTSAFCGYASDCLPNGASGSSCSPCDNTCQTPSACGTSSEWCSRYLDALVTVTAYGSYAHGHCGSWNTLETPQVVCALGSFASDYPDAPACAAQSYCDAAFGSRSLRPACSWPGSSPNCDPY
jgi:hypothetical protein